MDVDEWGPLPDCDVFWDPDYSYVEPHRMMAVCPPTPLMKQLDCCMRPGGIKFLSDQPSTPVPGSLGSTFNAAFAGFSGRPYFDLSVPLGCDEWIGQDSSFNHSSISTNMLPDFSDYQFWNNMGQTALPEINVIHDMASFLEAQPASENVTSPDISPPSRFHMIGELRSGNNSAVPATGCPTVRPTVTQHTIEAVTSKSTNTSDVLPPLELIQMTGRSEKAPTSKKGGHKRRRHNSPEESLPGYQCFTQWEIQPPRTPKESIDRQKMTPAQKKRARDVRKKGPCLRCRLYNLSVSYLLSYSPSEQSWLLPLLLRL